MWQSNIHILNFGQAQSYTRQHNNPLSPQSPSEPRLIIIILKNIGSFMSKRYSNCKDIQQFIARELIPTGWKYLSGSKHGKVCHPSQRGKITVPCSPSDSHAYQNFRKEVLRLHRKLMETPMYA